MKTLSQLQNDAWERIKEQIGEEVIQDQNVREIMPGLELLIRAELENIVKESFKNTRMGERIWENETGDPLIYGRQDGYDTALSDTKIKQNQFLNN